MIAAPSHTWLYTGSWPFSVHGIFPEDMESAYAWVGFKFEGPGWYPKRLVKVKSKKLGEPDEDVVAFGFLIEETGELRNGKKTYALSKYDSDPRAAFAAAAALPTR